MRLRVPSHGLTRAVIRGLPTSPLARLAHSSAAVHAARTTGRVARQTAPVGRLPVLRILHKQQTTPSRPLHVLTPGRGAAAVHGDKTVRVEAGVLGLGHALASPAAVVSRARKDAMTALHVATGLRARLSLTR